DGDGIPDVAVVNTAPGAGTVRVLLGNGDGTFTPAVAYLVNAYPESLTVGDFNRDGVPDLVTASYPTGTVCVLLGNGDGTFRTTLLFAAGGDPARGGGGGFHGGGSPPPAPGETRGRGRRQQH